jgi:hypothetical protein
MESSTGAGSTTPDDKTRASGGGEGISSAKMGDARLSPFPPLPLMLNRDRTVSAAISASLEPKIAKGKEKEVKEEKDHVEWARGRKGNVSPGQAAKKMFPKPSPAKRLYRRFFIKRDLVYVSFSFLH